MVAPVVPNPDFYLMPPLQQQLLDKTTGEPLAAGIVRFFSETDRITPKNVYSISGDAGAGYTFTSLGSELTLSGFGTFIDGSGNQIIPYLYPFDSFDPDHQEELYYIKVYYSDGSTFEFDQKAWPQNLISANQPIIQSFMQKNILNNQYFVEVSFPNEAIEGKVFTVGATDSTLIAPNWYIDTAGGTSFKVTQDAVGAVDAPGNPLYALKIDNWSGSFTTFNLRQRFENTPRALNSGFVAATIVMRDTNSDAYDISVWLKGSSGNPDVELLTFTTSGASTFEEYRGFGVEITPPNPGTADTAYTDFYIKIPSGAEVEIAIAQLVLIDDDTQQVAVIQETSQTAQNNLYQYYKESLEYKPISSYLVGWDFPLNPAQFGATVAAPAIGAAKSQYYWDQTIVFQSANSGVAASRATSGALVLTANVETQLALVQYLPQSVAREVLHNPLSVNFEGFTSIANKLQITITLLYTTDASLPNIASGTSNSVVASLNTDGSVASTNGTWSEVPRINNLGKAQCFVEQNIDERFFNYGFNGWDLEGIADASTATFFAIVVGTATIPITETLVVNSISLVPGNIPTKPAFQSLNEVFDECQYYYEKSYASSVTVGTAGAAGARFALQALSDPAPSGGATTSIRAQYFGLTYNTIKRTNAPIITIFTQGAGGAGNSVFGQIFNNGVSVGSNNIANFSTNWTETAKNDKSVYYAAATNTDLITSAAIAATSGIFGFILYHYQVDARLGIV